MAKREVDYVVVKEIGQKEFGFVLLETDGAHEIEVVVLDHAKNWVRTLGHADSLRGAQQILEGAFNEGFNVQGVSHQLSM